MVSGKPSVSVLILTNNGEKTIGNCLDGLLIQSFRDFEILLIDSCSQDNTIKIASQYPAHIVQIPAESFHHAKTRNQAISLSKGKFIVFLVQDAIPADNKWLEELLNPFEDPKIAATYSRQQARIETSPMERAFTQFTYPKDKRRFIIKKKNENDPGSFVLLSDVSSAYRRELVEFSSSVSICEDQEIALRLIKAGFEIAYVPNSVVYHSHSYNLLSLFRRYQLVGNPAGKFAGKGYSLTSSSRYAIRLFASSFAYMITAQEIKLRPFWFIYSIPYNSFKIFSFILGYLKKSSS